MRARTTIALAAALLAAAPAFTPTGSAVAQSAAPTAHRYVVGVSGMH